MSDEPIVIGAKANEDVTCSNCQNTLQGSEAHCFRGKKGEDIYFCSDCKQQIDEALKQETESPNYLGAIVLGLLAGIAGGAVWYFIEILTGYRIGYVALGVGFIIGWGVILGSGKKRGGALQIISAFITLLSVLGASYLSAIYSVNKYFSDEMAIEGGKLSWIWISPLNSGLLEMVVSPMGVFIWAIALYIGFRTPQARKL